MGVDVKKFNDQRQFRNKISLFNFVTKKRRSKTVAVVMEECDMSIKRRDLFTFIRHVMNYAHMYSFHLERYLPKVLSGLGILLEIILEIFFYFLIFHIVILYLCTIYMNFHSGDLELFVNCLLQTVIYLWATMVKLYFRRVQPKKLEDLFKFINSKYQTRSAIGFTYVTMDKILAMSNNWAKVFSYSSFLGTLFWSLLPLTFGDRSLPLPCWYPFDYKQPIIYETIYILQIIGQTQVAAAFAGSTGFFITLCILMSGQYNILFCSLKNILATVAINRKQKIELRKLCELQKTEINEYYCAKEIICDIDKLVRTTKNVKEQDFRYHFLKAFKKCIDHHRFIVKSLKKMEDFYFPIWFFKTGEVLFVLCLLAFVSVKSTSANSVLKMLTMAQYLVLVLWDLLIICYFSEVIFINSQRCGEALMRSPWYIRIHDIKFEYVFFLMNSARPHKLTAGKIITVNIEFFKTILSTAFSFFTLLQNLDTK